MDTAVTVEAFLKLTDQFGLSNVDPTLDVTVSNNGYKCAINVLQQIMSMVMHTGV